MTSISDFAVQLPESPSGFKYSFIDAFHGVLIASRLKTGTTVAPFNRSFGGRGSLLRYCRWYKDNGFLKTARQEETMNKHLARIFADVIASHSTSPEEMLRSAPQIGSDSVVYMAHDDIFHNQAAEEYQQADESFTYETVAKAKAKLQAGKVAKPVDRLDVVSPAADIEPQVTEYDRRDWPVMIRDHVGPSFRGMVTDEAVVIWQYGSHLQTNTKVSGQWDDINLTGQRVLGNAVRAHLKIAKPPAPPKKKAEKAEKTEKAAAKKKEKSPPKQRAVSKDSRQKAQPQKVKKAPVAKKPAVKKQKTSHKRPSSSSRSESDYHSEDGMEFD